MLLQFGTPHSGRHTENWDGWDAGGSVGLRWLLTMAYPWAAACWLTTNPFLQNSTWICCSTAPFRRHPLDPPTHWHTDKFTLGLNTDHYYKYSFFFLAVLKWNNLPVPIDTLTNLDSFKQAVWQLQASYQSDVPYQTINWPPLFLSSLSFLLFNTLTLYTFIPFFISALFLSLTFIACSGTPGT